MQGLSNGTPLTELVDLVLPPTLILDALYINYHLQGSNVNDVITSTVV